MGLTELEISGLMPEAEGAGNLPDSLPADPCRGCPAGWAGVDEAQEKG